MVFWGVSIEAGESHTIPASNPPRRLNLTRGSVMEGTSLNPWCAVYCIVGGSPPVIIFRADHLNTVSLKFEFEETQDIVFKLSGPRGVHLSGYYVVDRRQNVDASPLMNPEALHPVEMIEKLPIILKNVAMIEKYMNKIANELVKEEMGQIVERGLDMEHTTNQEKNEQHRLEKLLVGEAQTNNGSGSDFIGVNENGNESKCTSDDRSGALALISPEHGDVAVPSPSSQPTVDFSHSHQIDSNKKFLNFLLPSNLLISAIVSKLNEDFENNNIYGGIDSYLKSQQNDCSPRTDNEMRLGDSTRLKLKSSLEKSEMDEQSNENMLNRKSWSSLDLSNEHALKEKKHKKSKRENNEAKIMSENCCVDRKKLKKKESISQPTSHHRHGSEKKRSEDCSLVKAEMSKQKVEEASAYKRRDVRKRSSSSIGMSGDDPNLEVRKHCKRKLEYKDSNYAVESPRVDVSVIREDGKINDGESGSKSEPILKTKNKKVDVARDEHAEVSVEKKKKYKPQEANNDVGNAEKSKSCGHNSEKTVHGMHLSRKTPGASNIIKAVKELQKEGGAVKLKKA